MVGSQPLAALGQIARLKAEQELKKLAAFRSHVLAAHQRADASRAAMQQSYAAAAPLSMAEARMANAQAGRAARELARAERDLRQMQPRFDLLRGQAAREFGRAEALAELSRQALQDWRQRRDRGGA